MQDLVRDPDVVRAFLSDAAHVPGGFTPGVVFPRSVDDVAATVRQAEAVLPVGARSSLTGGATPRGEVVLSTRSFTAISVDHARMLIHVGAGTSLHDLQSALAGHGLWFPPAPTFDGATVGGIVSTNAAGAATFKYGTTRRWVEGLTVVLASGDVLRVTRGAHTAVDGRLVVATGAARLDVPVPSYTMPDLPKLSAGYYVTPNVDLVDLLVGSEGTLAVIVEATLKVAPRPRRAVGLLACADDEQACAVTSTLRNAAHLAWQGGGGLDVAAVEYMDARSLAMLSDSDFVRSGVPRPSPSQSLLLVQIDAGADDGWGDGLAELVGSCEVEQEPVVALPGDEVGAARLFELREAVPAAVNAAVGRAKERDAGVQKTAGDFIVPFVRLAESMQLYRRAFESRGLDYAVWGHASDGNLHPNVVPRSHHDVARGREALLEAARAVVAMGGSPLAEHGVGRNPLKQLLLSEMYGERGLNEMRAVKRAFDVNWKLAPGVLFPV